MNKKELVNKVNNLEQYIWNNADRVQCMAWDDFSDNILEHAQYWNNLNEHDLYEALERAEHIKQTIIKLKN